MLQFINVVYNEDFLTDPPHSCFHTGRESRWSTLRARHQATQQPFCIQCLLQRAALCAGLAAKRGLPGAGLQELGTERRLRQRGGGGVPRTSREAAKGISREEQYQLLMLLLAALPTKASQRILLMDL